MSGQAHGQNDIPIEVATTGGTHVLQPFTYRWDTLQYVDGYAFASDGAIAAWLPSEPFDSKFRPGRDKVIKLFRDDLEFSPLEPLPLCLTCNGTGIEIIEECEECAGTGEVDHECDCDLCTEEYDDCPECEGKGKFTGEDAKSDCSECRERAIEIHGQRFAVLYLRKIAALGDPLIAVDDDKMHFRAGLVKGVLLSRVK